MTKSVCTAAEGPFRHTLFLGLSVQSVSVSQGWNSQQSTITVQLVEDDCKTVPGEFKYYYPAPGQTSFWTGPDPGFVNPNIGAPAYFRIGDFEFAGLIQSWESKHGTGGNPVYSVTLCDPRLLLENLQIIISDYADSVENVYNLINPYGFLESLGFPCAQQFIKGASFGSPAGAYGGAQNNNEGTPYNLLKNATAALLSGRIHPKFSPYGKAVFRGNDPTGWGAIGGCGALSPDGFSPQIIADYGGNGYKAEYTVDISEIPFQPTYFRLAGPQDTLMNIISNACSLTGCDFFIELLITPAGDKVIKVKTTKRRAQPTLGEIEAFVAITDGVTEKNVGRELRNETTSTFLYGGYIQSIYEEDASNPVSGTDIIQHWGFNASGTFTEANLRAAAPAKDEWEVQIDLRDLNLGLVTPLMIDKVFIYENEMRCALGEYDTWFNFIQAFNQNAGTPMGLAIKAAFPNIKMNIDGAAWEAIGVAADVPALGRDAMGGLIVAGAEDANNITGTDAEDIKKIHKFVADFADKYYGKQFLVRLPFVCYRVDEDSGQTLYTDQPTNDGGWPSMTVGASGGATKTDILGLTWQPTAANPELETFRDGQGKVHSFVKFDSAPTGAYPTNRDKSVVYNSGLYLAANADEKVYEKDGIAAVVIKLGQAVAPNKNEQGVDKRMAGAIAVAVEQLALGNQVAGAGAIVAQFENDQDGQKGDFALAMETKRLTPDDVAISMISNTDRYGPYGFKGPPGQVKFESADTLTPWAYNGYATMDLAGKEMAKDSITFMQVGEKGGITVPGYPTKRLGQELRDSIPMFGSSSLTRGTFTVGTNSIPYFYIPSTAMTGSFGPNITSISINMGSNGVTTTYQFTTFSPTFGKFAKYNANQLQKMGKRRQEISRRNRLDDKINKRLAEAEAKINRAVDNVKANNPAKNVGEGAMCVISAEQHVQASFTGQTDFITYDGAATTARKIVVGKPNPSGAIMSWDGLLVPVSRGGDGGLPRYVTPTGSCSGIPGTTYQMDPPIMTYTEPIVNTSYLDPFATVSTPKHADNPNDPDFHNHVRRLAHSDYSSSAGTQTNMKVGEQKGDAFPEDFRFLALKGPLLIHGWGYDLEGKPIPNKIDTIVDTTAGIFEGEDLEDKFLDKWLRKPQTWPTAPLDLRFDRARGVWTVPSDFRIVQATAQEDISKGATGLIKLTNLRNTYDADGDLIDDADKLGVLKNPHGVDCPLVVDSGDKFYAFYDTADCLYYALPCAKDPCYTYFNSGCGSGTGEGSGEIECVTGWRESPVYVFGPGMYSSAVEITGLGSCTGCFPNTGTGSPPPPLPPVSGILVESIIKVCNIPLSCEYLDGSYVTGGGSGACGVFEELKFGKGLNLVGSGVNDCVFTAELDLKIKDDPYCDWSGEYADSYSYYDRLNLGTGLKITNLTACGSGSGYGNVVTIAADHSIKSENTECSSGNVLEYEFFNKLTFRSGISVTSGGDSCEYLIDSPMPEISDSGYCDWAPEVAGGTGCIEPFKCLTAGSGLKLGRIDDCSYIVHADHHLKDTDYCNWTATVTGYEFFNRINFGTGLQVVDEGDCEYTIRADHYIQDNTYCEWTPVVALERKFFNQLTLGTGLQVVQGTGGDCDFEIQADHYIKDLDYCDWTASVGQAPNASPQFFTNLELGIGLRGYFGADLCTVSIDADHYVTDQSYCNHGGFATEEFFTNLIFGTGLKLNKIDGAGCKYNIDADHYITDTASCDRASVVAEEFFRHLRFNQGLQVVNNGLCDFSINADHSIRGMDYCDHTDVLLENYGFFNKLSFDRGLQVSKTAGGAANCEYTIKADHFIKGTDYCEVEQEVDTYEFFNKINFDRGLQVTKKVGGVSNCEYTIKADHYVSKVDCDSTEVLAPTFFNNLAFHTGIDVEHAGAPGCEYLISSALKIKDIAYCDWTPASAADHQKYENLYFGTGLKVSTYVDNTTGCGFSIDADHYVTDTTYCDHTATITDKFFTNLNFGTGLKLNKQTGDGCKYNIDADHYITDNTYCEHTGEVVTNKFFNHLEFGSGLRVDDLSNCRYRIQADHYVSKVDCDGTEVLEPTFFNNLAFHTGIDVEYAGAPGCEYLISSALKIKDIAYCDWTPASAADHQKYENLYFGTGLKVSTYVDNTTGCGFSIDADHYLSSTGSTCPGTEVGINNEFFNHLSFGAGIGVKDHGGCKYEIYSCGGVQVKDSGYCDYTASIVECTEASCITYGSGLKLIGIVEGNARVDADHYISATGSTCPGTEVGINNKFFNHLSFGSGIGVKDHGGCKYEVYACGGTNVKDSGYCDYDPTYLECVSVDCIRYGSGLKISSIIDGEANISADHYITSTGEDCDNDTTIHEFFNHLSLGSGLGLKDRLLDGDPQHCNYELFACQTKVKDSNPCSPPVYTPIATTCSGFDCLEFGSGLHIYDTNKEPKIMATRYVVDALDAGSCKTYSHNPSPAWYETLHFRSGIHVSRSGSTCEYIVDVMPTRYKGNTTCSLFVAATVPPADQPLDSVFSGPGIKIKQDATDDCAWAIGTDFGFSSCSGAFVRPVETFYYGCGIVATETPGDSCGVDISLDPLCGGGPLFGGLATGVQVVRDVCCTGDSLSINYITLMFSSCGLFTGVVADDGLCVCCD